MSEGRQDVESATVDGAAAEPEPRGDAGPGGSTPGGRTAGGSVEIEAPPERVWRALTDAAELERWFPLEARVEPGEGGSIWMSWRNEYQGSSRILAWDPPSHLRTTWGEMDGEGGAQVTDYWLKGRGGRTRLRVVTSGFPEDASWDEWVEGTRKGWAYELRSLKHYLERHPGRDREVVYLRRRVRGGRREAWDRLFGTGGLPERPLGGSPVDVDPPRQYAAAVEDPAGALLRVSTEPTGPGAEGWDVTLFLSAWGDASGRAAELRGEWSSLLERLFPDGEDPQADRAAG